MKRMLIFLFVFFISLLVSASEPKLVTVLFTNDTHGMAWAFQEPGGEPMGGLAARKSLVDQIRQDVEMQGGSLLLLSGGNITMGDPRSNICRNIPLVKGMNLIGYDAMSVGNHEFDLGLDVYSEMKREARFPFLSLNMFSKRGKKLGEGFVEKKLPNGLKVALIGVSSKSFESISASGIDGSIRVKDPMPLLKRTVPKLRKRNDLVILLSSLGYYENGSGFEGAVTDREVAEKFGKIDLIVGGHTKHHLEKPAVVNGVEIVQTGGYGKWLGRVDLHVQNGKIVQRNYKIYRIKKRREDKVMLSMLKGFKCEFSKKKIGEVLLDLKGEKSYVRSREAEIGNIITDVMRERGRADISFINSGSIRGGIARGIVTEKDVYGVFPFSDTMVVGMISGSELLSLLERFAALPSGHGGRLQVSGMKVEISDGNLKSAKIGGKPVDPSRKYRFATNSYLARGGDGYGVMKRVSGMRDTGYSVPAIVVEYLKMEKILKKPSTGRIFYKK